jgi:hypothetical protein
MQGEVLGKRNGRQSQGKSCKKTLTLGLPSSASCFLKNKRVWNQNKELRIQCCGKKVPSYPNFNFDVGCPKKDKLSSPFEVVGL